MLRVDSNYPRMLRAILNKSWRQHRTKQQLYGHPPPITKTIKVRRARHAGHCWKSRGELISDVLLWTPSHGRAKTGQPARTHIQHFCVDTGCSSEDLPEVMNDREGWRKRVRDIRAGGTTRRWYIYIYIYLYIWGNVRFWWIWQDDKISEKIDKSDILSWWYTPWRHCLDPPRHYK